MTAFTSRHVGTGAAAQKAMLETLGYGSLDALMDAAVPQGIRQAVIAQSSIPQAATEREALAELRAIANENTVRRSMIGLGYYDTIMPSVIKRNVLENPSWYTAYTPYQPEISQGRLEALLTFQTMVADLTGMATANAGMLDEASAAAEAMLMARRASKTTSARFFVDVDAFPQTKAVLATRAEPLDIELVEVDWTANPDLTDGFGGLVQYPGASGAVRDISAAIDAIHAIDGVAIVASDLLALTLLTSPGQMGADIVLGNSQRFGVPLGFGGPHSAFFAVRAGLERSMPGRLIGVSRDADGNPAYRLTLQAREQHIRREKATSNICTAQVLLAVLATMYAVYHGPEGLRSIALGVAERAARFADRARAAGLEVVNSEFFDTVQVRVPQKAESIAAAARAQELLLWVVDADTVQLSFDELSVGEHTGILAGGDDVLIDSVFGLGEPAKPNTELDYAHTALPAALEREGEILAHENFNLYHSETSMMRYLKRLADKDFALDRGMIPLGSCTMKLNAATEMEAVSWREFGGLHPFAPVEDVTGYLLLTSQLEEWLTELTGYDSISLQPNAGSQGELAGLLAIRGYHLSRGDDHRTICIIPSSAHGTNAASAVLAGMKVVVVACNENGDVDIDDLRAKIAEHRDNLAALMVTYPSTHGVYEHGIREITDAVHEAGGQVYIDGANLNALLGFARYGDIGGDVSHLNLHKTFAIPHGGGGPGVGPVASKAHLAPFLPGHPFAQSTQHPAFDGSTGGPGRFHHGGGAVAGSPYGSSSILPISWAYVRMMGSQGLRFATASAVLAANYVAARLREHYPVLYSGDNGLVAHECILDLRPLTAETGVTVDDVAKRLVDYGFHAPTMSFPVAGTLMVEPTESEDIAELDRFIDAMIAIRHEADAVGRGEWPADDNPLHNAPHTADSVISGEWTHPYSREVAAFPWRQLDGFSLPNGHVKYWPAVRRVDGAFGDRNLVCACPDPSAFA
ncbi:MAG: aminomethyl-transferring glycine dehydrogenase [Actinomycetota bacterium]|jgi:glycine dehydrogenase